MGDSRENTTAEQRMVGASCCMTVGEWEDDHLIAIAAGRSPSGVESAHVAGVLSKKQNNMNERIAVRRYRSVQPERNKDLRPISRKVVPCFRILEGSGYGDDRCSVIAEIGGKGSRP